MASGSQYSHPEKYGFSQVKTYAQNFKEQPLVLAFVYPAMMKYLQSEIPGKKVLDIGCGPGN